MKADAQVSLLLVAIVRLAAAAIAIHLLFALVQLALWWAVPVSNTDEAAQHAFFVASFWTTAVKFVIAMLLFAMAPALGKSLLPASDLPDTAPDAAIVMLFSVVSIGLYFVVKGSAGAISSLVDLYVQHAQARTGLDLFWTQWDGTENLAYEVVEIVSGLVLILRREFFARLLSAEHLRSRRENLETEAT